MIRLSSTAEGQLEQLTRYYAERGRDRAIDNLANCIERACARLTANKGIFFDAPRPYPDLTQYGWRWTKEGAYWIAFALNAQEAILTAIFHEAANIPERL